MNKRRIIAATYGIGKYTEDSGCLQLWPLQMHRSAAFCQQWRGGGIKVQGTHDERMNKALPFRWALG